MRGWLALGALMLGLDLVTAAPAAAQAATPPGCQWRESTTAATPTQELWCRGADDRFKNTGRTIAREYGNVESGCPEGQGYDGSRCVPLSRISAASPRSVAAAPSPRSQAVAVSTSAPSELAASLDAIIAVDAAGWVFNRYDAGSVGNERVLSRARKGREMTVYGEYSYNGGSPGWLKAKIADGAVVCLEYWDFQGRCRPVGQSHSQQVLAAVVIGAMASGPSGGGSSAAYEPDFEPTGSSSGSSGYAPTPTSSGLYGNCHGGAAYGC